MGLQAVETSEAIDALQVERRIKTGGRASEQYPRGIDSRERGEEGAGRRVEVVVGLDGVGRRRQARRIVEARKDAIKRLSGLSSSGSRSEAAIKIVKYR